MQLWYESDQNLLRPSASRCKTDGDEEHTEISRGETGASPSGPYDYARFFFFIIDNVSWDTEAGYTWSKRH